MCQIHYSYNQPQSIRGRNIFFVLAARDNPQTRMFGIKPGISLEEGRERFTGWEPRCEPPSVQYPLYNDSDEFKNVMP